MKILINGCFDCFHDGHKHLINYAMSLLRTIDDYIYILINRDESYFNLRGYLPKDNERIRQTNILDYFMDEYIYRPITMFFNSEEELLEKIKRIKPNLLIKGSDRTDVSTITGFGVCPICILPRLKDENGIEYSSTRIKKGL